MKKLTFFIALLVLLVVSVSIVTADNGTSDALSIDDGSADVDEISASDNIDKVAADSNINKVLKATSDNKKVAVKKTNDKLSADEGVKIKKVWKDNNDASGKRPSSVNVTLKLNGKTWGEPVILDAQHDWETAVKLVLGVGDKLEVVEEAVPGYTTKVTGDAKSGFTITNTLEEDDNSTSTDDDDTTDGASDDTPEKETQVVKKTTTTTKIVKKQPKKVKDKNNTGNPILLGVLAISLAGLAYQLHRKE